MDLFALEISKKIAEVCRMKLPRSEYYHVNGLLNIHVNGRNTSLEIDDHIFFSSNSNIECDYDDQSENLSLEKDKESNNERDQANNVPFEEHSEKIEKISNTKRKSLGIDDNEDKSVDELFNFATSAHQKTLNKNKTKEKSRINLKKRKQSDAITMDGPIVKNLKLSEKASNGLRVKNKLRIKKGFVFYGFAKGKFKRGKFAKRRKSYLHSNLSKEIQSLCLRRFENESYVFVCGELKVFLSDGSYNSFHINEHIFNVKPIDSECNVKDINIDIRYSSEDEQVNKICDKVEKVKLDSKMNISVESDKITEKTEKENPITEANTDFNDGNKDAAIVHKTIKKSFAKKRSNNDIIDEEIEVKRCKKNANPILHDHAKNEDATHSNNMNQNNKNGTIEDINTIYKTEESPYQESKHRIAD
ncbi:DgyrCDS6572 [Dimorphilus gyrociliatus]|uniref:DgyrCDS6572 n=1 Tax=Dimorphilus gyrociliatus TaxID=2664684 RepID=A0A7I8VQ03_9ANNE|nr:DgyrCDS6572 [Dimorphilus gyrociliatus]